MNYFQMNEILEKNDLKSVLMESLKAILGNSAPKYPAMLLQLTRITQRNVIFYDTRIKVSFKIGDQVVEDIKTELNKNFTFTNLSGIKIRGR
jgi:hypothetical protein